ncbi:PHP domain-containing protein [Chryseobacterium sp.]|uniref:PHP domain-containing protein n=1 Tax=Chryseobacterium sp. TaxID=1871047 RepID=UPI0025BC0685|nr:PHP domain-containing protein [Chryseobacterium sp.]
MKKIDLHIHTVASISDSPFDFCLDTLKEYVTKLELDCIAITNHNLFDLKQFEVITQELGIRVLPGIEIDLEKGHLLLISENKELTDFATKCNQVKGLINTKEDYIDVETLNKIFPDLTKYLLIPHYDKSPNITADTLAKLSPHILAGEVTSAKKFTTCIKDNEKLTPVIFSDIRIKSGLKTYPTRQTFIDLEEITLGGIKYCLSDKSKVSMTKSDGNKFFQVTDDGLYLSTGLNVVLGERSSGKTHTLGRIMESQEEVKYIKQFALLQNDEEKFEKLLTTRHSTVNEKFFKEFKDVVDEVKNIDLRSNKLDLEKYISSLLKFASESDKFDTYSKTILFSESLLTEIELKSLENLIKATETLIENTEYKDIISKHLIIENLKNLLRDLIIKHIELHEDNLKKRWLNDVIQKIKSELRLKSTSTPPDDIDLYQILIENEKVRRFNSIVEELKKEREIDRKEIRGFKVIAKTKTYSGAQEMKNKSGKMLVFSDAFSRYDNPYSFLNSLKTTGLPETEYHKFFIDICYQTLNKHNVPVSGGERSEFNLLHEINDALQYDMLLIDEPESSFDNLFLKNEVNELLKSISQHIPVVVVTHNNTVGASIQPDYILYTKKTIVDQEISYQVFSGHPSQKTLKDQNGKEIENYDILLKCLEAGNDAYEERRIKTYETLKN